MTGMSRSAAKRKRASAGAKLTDEQRRRALGESSCTFGGSRRGTVTTLLDFVASRFDYYTREQWVAQIQRGALRVNGEAATPEAPLPPGARIAMDMPRSNEPEVDLAYRIIHEFKQAASPPAATPPAKRSRLPDTAAAAQPTGDADADADGGGGKDARPGGDAAALPDPSPRPEPAASSGGQQQQQQQGQDRASTKGQEEEQEEQPFWFIAVEKSANLPVSPSGRYRKNTLSYELQYNVCLDAHPVHRIDKETSGCVIVAMNAATSAALSALFAGSDVTKEYTAVLVGELRSESAVDQPVLPKHSIAGEGYCTGDLHPMKRIRMACHPQGKPCRTTFTPLAVANGLTLVRVAIEQGRTHQIRVHAEWLGHPLLGDKVYGHGEGSEAQTLRWTRNEEPFETPFGVVGRQLLHCSRIRLPGGVREGVPPADVVSDPAPFFRAFPACEPLFAKAAGQAGEAAAQPTKREEDYPLCPHAHAPMNHVQFTGFEECTSPAEPSRVVCGTSFVGSTGAGLGERTHTHSVFFDSDECEEEVVVVVPAEDVAPQKPCSRTADPQRRKRRLLKVFENGRLLDDCGRAVWKSVAVPDTPTMQMDTVYGIITRSLGWHDVNRNTYRQGEDNGAVGNLWAFNGRPLVNAQDLDDGQWVVAGTAKSRFAAPLEGVRGGRSPSPPSPVSPRRSEWVARLSDPSNFTGTQRTKHAGARRVSLAA